MTHPVPIHFRPVDLDALPRITGRIVAFADGPNALSPAIRRLDKLTRGAVTRLLNNEAFDRLKPGEAVELAWPSGLLADALQIVRLPKRTDIAKARKAGGAIGRALTPAGTTVVAENHALSAEIAFGVAMRAYDFTPHKTGERKVPGHVAFMVANPEAVAAAAAPGAAVAEGVFFTRDLVNEPANVLTTMISPPVLPRCRNLGWMSKSLRKRNWPSWAWARCWAWGRGRKALQGRGHAMARRRKGAAPLR
jgi:leucyl aminopeptidase